MANKYANFSRKAKEKLRKEKSCENKKEYKTQEEAATTGNKTYKCSYCKKWHTSASKQSFINKMRKRVI